MKISTVTTFNQDGYNRYGKRMLATYAEFWPKEVILNVYCEDFCPEERYENIVYHDLHSSSPELVVFKNKYKDKPWANGKEIPPSDILVNMSKERNYSLKKEVPIGSCYKWNAVAFSHKVFTLYAFAKMTDSNIIIWLDGDIVTHNIIDDTFFNKFEKDIATAYLGRIGSHTETGFVYYNINNPITTGFIKDMVDYYIAEDIFKLIEWHDCYVYDEMRIKTTKNGVKHQNITNSSFSKGHVFINSFLGEYMDHVKGERKDSGKSNKSDLKVKTKSKYWGKL